MPVPEENLKSGLSVRFSNMMKANGKAPEWSMLSFFQSLKVFSIDVPRGLNPEDRREVVRKISRSVNVGQMLNIWS